MYKNPLFLGLNIYNEEIKTLALEILINVF